MSFSPITHLRHVDFAVPDYAKQVEFYRTHWGLTEVGRDSDVTYFAAEGSPEQYITRVRRSPDKRIDLVSFGAADAASVDQLAQKLARDGNRLICEPGNLQTLGGGYGFRFFDIDGRTIEVSADVEVRRHRKVEVKEDIPVRLSHVVINSDQPEKTKAFYEKYFGFRLSDTIRHPAIGDLLYLMRCNAQHHCLGIARGPHVALHHLSFEMRGLDEYMRGTGRLLRSGQQKLWAPGRHAAGDNTFSYFLDPNFNIMEYTTELITLDEDSWHPHVYDAMDPDTQDQWGTATTGGEDFDWVIKQMSNDPDRGLFAAPPV